MTYQAIAFELDGTLLNPQGQILDSSKQAIQRARDKGLKIFFITGRHHTAVKPYYHEINLDTPIICCNGTYVYHPHTHEFSFGNPLSREQAEKIISVSEKYQIQLLMYSRDAMNYITLNPHMEKFLKWVESCPAEVRPLVTQVDDFRTLYTQPGECIWKFVISHPERQNIEKAIAELPPTEFSCEWSWVDRVDVANNGNSKGGRLLDVLKVWDIDPQNVIGFGDNHNDISMITAVGLGIAMGNAEEEVKRRAKRITLSNEEDGIAQVLNEIL